MSEPIHVIVTLSPETIAALAEALRPKPARGAPVLLVRPPYAREPVDALAALPAWLEGRSEATTREVAEGLGIPAERQDRTLAMILGRALAAQGWSPATRRTGGTRERVYRPHRPQGFGLYPEP